MRSPKFLQADGGYERVIWLPKAIKDSLIDFIPEDLAEKIPTEEDANSIKDIRKFLREKNHPVMERLKESKANAAETETETLEEEVSTEIEAMPEMEGVPMAQVAYTPELSLPSSGGMKIIFKNAKIYAEKVIIKRK
jgi:acetyl-CoA decarbonylase/synthase, CODH/ACS complex subunit beta